MDDPRKPPLGSDDATIVPEAAGSYSVPSRDAAATLTPIPQGETPVPGRPSDASPTRVSTSSAYFSGGVALQPGTVLVARYEILKVLGEGGMGAVYRAKDRELDRVVALKVIRPELAGNPAIIQRFKQELILARQVTHRNVIRIYDLGEAEGMKFITMEYVEGQDLHSLLLERHKFSPEEAVEVMQQVCLALDCAHREGVIHRDLKPQNIMRDVSGRIVVMDFGLARSLEAGGMTQTGALIGTMEYMSPEQALGSELDQRSDIFTVGLIFYELLSGKVPYKADSALASLLKRTQERAIPVADLEKSTPRVLSNVVSKCLERDPKARYQSAQELLNDLEGWQGRRAAAALRLPRLRVRGQIIPWTWLGLAAAILAIAIAAFLLRGKFTSRSASSPAPAAPEISLAILPFRNASGDASINWMGTTVSEMLRTDMGESASLRTVSSDRVNQILHDLRIAPDSNLDPDTLRRVAEFTSADRLLWGQYLKLGERVRIDATLQDLKRQRNFALKVEAANEKELPKALQQLAESVERSLALPPEKIKELQAKVLKPSSRSVQALRYYNEGLQLARQGKDQEAQKSLQAATREDPNFALAFAQLGAAYTNLGYGNEAEQATRRAVDLSQNLPPQEKGLIAAIQAQSVNDSRKAIEAYETLANILPDNLDIQFALAGLYKTAGSFDKARAYYAKLLSRDPKYVEALYGIAAVEINDGKAQSALEYLNRALPVTVELGNDQEQSKILYGIGAAYYQMNKSDAALSNYQQALAIQRRTGDQRGAAQTLNGMGQLQDALGKSPEALKSFQEALKLRQNLGDKTGIGDTLIDLSNFYEGRGENDRALSMLKQSLQIQRETGNQIYEALCLNNIGMNYADKGQYDDAVTYFTQALQLREKLKDSIGLAESNYAMAEALAKFSQYDQALVHYLRALELWRSLNDKRRAAFASYGLGNVFEQKGRLGAALKAKEEALKTIREVQDRIGMAEMLGGYAESLNLLGRGEEAQKNLEEALALAREVKNQNLVAQSLNFQGDSFFYRGDLNAARKHYEQALQVASRATDQRLILISKFNLAKVAVKEGHSGEAIRALRVLTEQADAAGLGYISLECSVYLGEALVNSKDYPQARREVERTLGRSEKLGLQTLQAKSHYLLATVLRLTGNGTEASQHYADAHRILEEMNNETKSNTLLKRADLSRIYAESGK